MRIDRRIFSTSLSTAVIRYLGEKGYSQAEMAKLMHVSEGFISLVKSRERVLTLEHIELVGLALNVPTGAFMLGVTKPKRKLDPARQRIFDLSEQLVLELDKMEAAIHDSHVSAK